MSDVDNQNPADPGFDGDDLLKLSEWRMPFGRFRDTPLIDLPDEYLLWFQNRAEFPAGQLGRLMRLALEVRANGTAGVVRELARRRRELNSE